MSRQVRHDIFNIDPKRIVLEGFYVREADEDEDFDAFCDSVRARGEIDMPLAVRTTGPIDARRYVLVWGRRRLSAALRLNLALVPARDLGDIPELEAIKFQLAENLNRRAMTPAQTARAFWELSQRDVPNVELARAYGRTESYISYLVKTGEAVAALTPDEQHALNQPGVLRIRHCQDVARGNDLEARIASLRALLAAATTASSAEDEDDGADRAQSSSRRAGTATAGQGRVPRTKREDEMRPFLARDLRHGEGRSFRVKWTERELAVDPVAFIEELAGVLRGEVTQLVERLELLHARRLAGDLPDGVDADAFQRAAALAYDLAGWLQEHTSAASKTSNTRRSTGAGHTLE